jgi:hypothetical protein
MARWRSLPTVCGTPVRRPWSGRRQPLCRREPPFRPRTSAGSTWGRRGRNRSRNTSTNVERRCAREFAASITRSLQASMRAELREIERAASNGTRDAGRGLRTELRRQVTSAEWHAGRADERDAAHRSLLSCPWHRTALSGLADSLQRPHRRVPHLARPAVRRLDRGHLEQPEQPRCIRRGRG